jgi:hypothetical protein
MRTLDPNLKTATQQQITEPIWLVECDMGATVLRASGRETLTWNSQTWDQDLGLEMMQVTPDMVEFSLDNSDRSVSLLCLGNQVKGNSVAAWLYYQGYAQARFTGVLDDWETDARQDRVKFYGSSVAAKAGKFPPDIISEGLWNHLPPPGTIIVAGSQPIILESTPQ